MKHAKAIDSVMAALYESISGPAGRPRNWRKLRRLFHPAGRLLRTVVSERKTTLSILTVDEFIAVAEPYFQAHAFFERELARRIERFGHVVHVWSTYGAFATSDEASLIGRGINSVQLWFDGKRWWVMSMLWDDERPQNPLPNTYLRSPRKMEGKPAVRDGRH